MYSKNKENTGGFIFFLGFLFMAIATEGVEQDTMYLGVAVVIYLISIFLMIAGIHYGELYTYHDNEGNEEITDYESVYELAAEIDQFAYEQSPEEYWKYAKDPNYMIDGLEEKIASGRIEPIQDWLISSEKLEGCQLALKLNSFKNHNHRKK